MSKAKIGTTGFGITWDLSEVNLFTNDFIAKLSGENRILEKIVNTVLQSEEISKEFKDKIIKLCGEDCFKKILVDGTYIWKGL